jgi:hypothetical protein
LASLTLGAPIHIENDSSVFQGQSGLGGKEKIPCPYQEFIFTGRLRSQDCMQTIFFHPFNIQNSSVLSGASCVILSIF